MLEAVLESTVESDGVSCPTRELVDALRQNKTPIVMRINESA
jgi:hypothetical protein